MSADTDDIPSSKPPQEPPPIFAPPPLPARPPRSSTSHEPSTSHNEVPSRKNDPSLHDLENDPDIEEEISAQMTASYSEISFNSDGESPNSDCDTAVSLSLDQLDSPLTIPDLPEHIKQRPVSLQYENNPVTPTNPTNNPARGTSDVSGTIHVDGSNMTYYVAEDLEYKIKLSSPITKKSDSDAFPGTSSRNGTPSNNLYRQILVPQFTQVDVTLLTDLESEAQRMATSIDNLTENLSGILHSMSSITADNVDIYKDAVSKMSDAMDSNIKGMYTIIAKAEEVSHTMKNVHYHAERIKEIKRLVDLFESNL